MTDRQQQIIFYALNKSLEQCDAMFEEIVDEITENVNELDTDTLWSILCDIRLKLKEKYFWDTEDKELAVKLLVAIEREFVARNEE